MSNYHSMNETATNMEEIQNAYTLLEQRNAQLEQENAELTAKFNWLMEQFRLSQSRRFGSSSEKILPAARSVQRGRD